jgi:hypothetical protein
MLLIRGAAHTIKNNEGASARKEARLNAIDIYSIFDYRGGIQGLVDHYPQYAILQSVNKPKRGIIPSFCY